MGLSGETLVDLLEALGHAFPHSSCKPSESSFLRSLRELDLWTQSWARLPRPSEAPPHTPELARMVPVPLLSVVSGVTVSFPAPPSMLSAFWFPLLPLDSVLLPLGFYKICHDISSGWSR